VVICLSGHRSPFVAYRLKQRGFKDVSYLAWGMISWLISGGPTEKGG
jgi:rhodanese-related sulfurtransferase